MSYEGLKDEQFDSFVKRGKRRINSIGKSKAIIIPSFLFKMFWKKEDGIEVYIPNNYTIIVVNEKAKERELKSQKNEIEVDSKYAAPYR